MNTDKRQKQYYRVRYMKVMRNLRHISKMHPREQYMNRLMDRVIFQDFETAIDGVIEDYRASNDNSNNRL